jgi:hypothetical protein
MRYIEGEGVFIFVVNRLARGAGFGVRMRRVVAL